MNVSTVRRGAFAYICLLCILGVQGLCMQAEVTKSVFGTMPDGTKIEIFTLHEGDMTARIMTYGARLVSLDVPDRNGKMADVVLGYDSLTAICTTPKPTLARSSDAMATASDMAHLFWTASGMNCRRTTATTVSMAEPSDSTSECGPLMKFQMESK